jgi:hypothetical protein
MAGRYQRSEISVTAPGAASAGDLLEQAMTKSVTSRNPALLPEVYGNVASAFTAISIQLGL